MEKNSGINMGEESSAHNDINNIVLKKKTLNGYDESNEQNNYYDLIIRFCFINKIYNLSKVNELLDEYNCKLFNI